MTFIKKLITKKQPPVETPEGAKPSALEPQKINGFSLKHKLLVIIAALPIIAVGIIVYNSVLVFKNDKISYIYGSSLSNAKSIAGNLTSQVSASVNIVKGLTTSFDLVNKKFAKTGKDYFNSEKSLKDFALMTNEGSEIFRIHKEYVDDISTELKISLINVAVESGLAIYPVMSHVNHIAMTVKVNENVAFAIFENADLFSLFSSSKIKNDILVHTDLGLLSKSNLGSDIIKSIKQKAEKLTTPETTFELDTQEGTFLASIVKLPFENLVVVSMVDKKEALRAIDSMVKRSVAFSVGLLSLFIIFGIFASGTLTYSLRELTQATAQIQQGNFAIKIEPKSKDEIGALGFSFNKMAQEVSRLMEATAHSARMEAELKTAQTVQETLFPHPKANFGPINIFGSSIPASECGGDWWHYSCIDHKKVFLWVGDATGHGAPAALLTSAARAAASVIENYPDITPAKALDVLNKAIYDTSKAKMMMTFFLASIDFEKGTFTYSNASHDPPFMLSHTVEGKPKRKDFEPLLDVNNPRLGEKRDVVYKEVSIPFSPGDKLIFYTDGIMDVKDKAGNTWGERKFINALTKINEQPSIDDTVTGIVSEINSYREGTPLDDDVTLVMVEFKKGA